MAHCPPTVPQLCALHKARHASFKALFARSIELAEATQTCDELIAAEIDERKRLNAAAAPAAASSDAASAGAGKAGTVVTNRNDHFHAHKI